MAGSCFKRTLNGFFDKLRPKPVPLIPGQCEITRIRKLISAYLSSERFYSFYGQCTFSNIASKCLVMATSLRAPRVAARLTRFLRAGVSPRTMSTPSVTVGSISLSSSCCCILSASSSADLIRSLRAEISKPDEKTLSLRFGVNRSRRLRKGCVTASRQHFDR